MEILGLIFLWFEMHAVAKASDLFIDETPWQFLSQSVAAMTDRANPALPVCSPEERLRDTLEKASDRLMMKLANLPITINCFVLPTARMPAQCAACAWRQRMGIPAKINVDELSWAFMTSTMTTICVAHVLVLVLTNLKCFTSSHDRIFVFAEDMQRLSRFGQHRLLSPLLRWMRVRVSRTNM